MKKKGDAFQITVSILILGFVLVAALMMSAWMIERQAYKGFVYKITGEEEYRSYFYQVLSAPCLVVTKTGLDGTPVKFVFSKTKLENVGTSIPADCVNFGNLKYHIKLTDGTTWEIGDASVPLKFKEIVNLFDEDKSLTSIAKIEFGATND